MVVVAVLLSYLKDEITQVATVASPHNHALVKSLGADVVFDYKSPDVISEIKKATNNKIQAALDTIAEEETQLFTVKVIGVSGGKALAILPPTDAAKNLRPDVEPLFTLMYTALGRPFFMKKHYPASPEDRAYMVKSLTKFARWAKDGTVKPNRIRMWEGGLESVKDGLKFMMDGKVTGEKIVYRV